MSLTESRAEQRPSLDIAGAVTVTGGLALLVYGIVSTDTRSWGSPATILTLAGAAALLAVVRGDRGAHRHNPLVPLGIFRLRSVAAANGIAVTIGAALFGLFFFLSLYLQQVKSYSPLKAGVAFLPAALSTMAGAIVGTRIVTRPGHPAPAGDRPADGGRRPGVAHPALRRRRVFRERFRTAPAVPVSASGCRSSR